MKKLNLNFVVIPALLVAIFAFTTIRSGGIQGKITPAEGIEKVLAVSGRDTLTAEINNNNIAFRNVKTGTYLLLIKAKAPYKDTLVENVAVIDSTVTDFGEIKLDQ